MTPADLPAVPFAALVLAGGRGRRLGGVDKAALDVAGTTLLDRALLSVARARPIVVVGPPRDLPAHIRSVQEQPVGGGPLAAVSAGLVALKQPASPSGFQAPRADIVVVLACDMPFVDAAAVDQLVAATPHLASADDGVVYVDPDGRRQHLAAAYRVGRLEQAVAAMGSVRNLAMRDLSKRLTMIEIATDPEMTLDCDTWPDVERSCQRLLEER